MKELTNIYKETGQQFVDDLFKDYLLVTEKLSGSSFSFERHGSELQFFKGSNKQPINLVDRTLMMYYEQVIQYIQNKTEGHVKDLPEYWRFCFQYFVNNQPGAIKYDNLPTNNLLLTHIQVRNPKGKIAKVIEDPRVLRDWAEILNVTPLIPIFSGYLKEAQKKKIREFLSTPKEDQLEVFGTSSFAKYLIDALNPTIKQTTLQNDLDKPIDSIIFKFFKQGTNQIFTAKMIDPYTQGLMKDKEPIDLRRAPADINEILLLDILAFVEERGLRGGELLTSVPEERYLELMSNLFNDYITKRGVDLQKLDIEKAKFAKGPEFNLNLDLITNQRTKEILQKSESLQNLYKIMVGSLRKKRNPERVGSVMTKSVVEDFNKMIDKITDTINTETDGKFKTFGDYLNTKVTESIECKDLEELVVEEKVLNYNNFIHLGKIDINEDNINEREITKGNIEKFWIKAYKQYTAKEDMITDVVKASHRTGDHGEVLRGNFGPNDGTAEAAIDNFLVSRVAGLKKGSYRIEELPVGYLSSDYAAYKIVIQKATNNKLNQAYGISDFFVITNRYKISKKTGEASIVGKKDLTPATLGVEQGVYKNWASLLTPVKKFFDTGAGSRYPENYKNFILASTQELIAHNGPKFDNFTAYANAPLQTIAFPISKSLFDGIDQLSIQNIRNDYGEILGGFMLFNILKDPGKGLSFPTSKNERLVDFYFDDYSVSSKGGKKGGTPTGDTVIQKMYDMHAENDLSFVTASEQDFYNNVIDTWVNPIKLARSATYGRIMNLCSVNLNDHSKSAYWYLLQEAELEPNNATQDSVEAFLDNLYTDKVEFTKFLRTFWEKSGMDWNESKLKTNVDGFGGFKGNHKLGVVFYPLMVEATNVLNQKYSKELTKYTRIVTNIKQLYLEMKVKQGKFEFKTIPFSTADFEFEQKASIPNPFNANMGIAVQK
jgi:hypothetical protein